MTHEEEILLVAEIRKRIWRMVNLTRKKPCRAYIHQTSFIRFLHKIAKQHGKEQYRRLMESEDLCKYLDNN